MADDEYTPPEEAVSDAPDIADEQDGDDENYQQDDWTKTDYICPECEAHEVWQIGYMRSPDDFDYHYRCRNCNEEWDD